MADTVTATTGTGTEAGDAEVDLERGARGQLVVKDRAVSKIAVAAALSVPGVVRQSGGLLTLPGRDLPRAEVTMGSDAVAVTLYLAIAWPCPVALLSREVHETVTERVETLTGFALDHLHIVVVAATTSPTDARQLADRYGADAPPVPARTPLARPAAAVVAVVAAVVLIGVAVLAGREFLIAQDVISPAAWLRNSVRWIADLHWQTWMVPAGIAATVMGVILVCVALAPRTRTHLPAVGTPVVWLRPTDVARMCSARAGTVGGVGAVHTTVDRRRATVHVTPNGEVAADDLEQQVRESVAPSLAVVASPLELRIRMGRVKP